MGIRIYILAIFAAVNCLGQNQINLTYDQSGNRIQFGTSTKPVIALEPDTLFLMANDTAGLSNVTNVGVGTLEWTASTADDWISIITASGEENDTVRLEFLKNDLREVRQGFVTIASDNQAVDPKDLVVIQQGKENESPFFIAPLKDLFLGIGFGSETYALDSIASDPEGDSLVFSFSIVDELIVTGAINGASLLFTEASAGATDVILTVEDGFGGVASDTFLVDVSEDPILQISTDTIHAGASEESYSFEINNTGSGDLVWQLASQSSWITIESSTSGTNDAEVDILVAKNESVEPRLGSLLVIGTDAKGSPANVFVKQVGRENSPPEQLKQFESLELEEGFELVKFDLTDYFSDPDGDVLSFRVLQENEVVEAQISDQELLISYNMIGETVLQIEATDQIDTILNDLNVVVTEVLGLGIQGLRIYPNPSSGTFVVGFA